MKSFSFGRLFSIDTCFFETLFFETFCRFIFAGHRIGSRDQVQTATGRRSTMTSPFFRQNWEEDTQEALIAARTRVVAFIEGTAKNPLKMQLQWVYDAIVPTQEAIRLMSAFLLVSKRILKIPYAVAGYASMLCSS